MIYIHGGGRHGRDRMVVGFITTYAIRRGVLDTTLCNKVCQ